MRCDLLTQWRQANRRWNSLLRKLSSFNVEYEFCDSLEERVVHRLTERFVFYLFALSPSPFPSFSLYLALFTILDGKNDRSPFCRMKELMGVSVRANDANRTYFLDVDSFNRSADESTRRNVRVVYQAKFKSFYSPFASSRSFGRLVRFEKT